MSTEPSLLTTGLFGQLETVRRTVFRMVLVFIGASLAAYPFAAHTLHFVKQPLPAKLVIYAPLEGFLGHIKVSLATGFLLATPFILYEIKRLLQVICRIQPRTANLGVGASAGSFLLGIAFCYGIILPVTLNFLLSYGGDNIAPGISVSKYLSLTLGLSAACGVIFQLPLVALLLHRLDFISIDFLTGNRRYAVIFAAVFTAILTPTPDAYTMSLLLVPLLGLYEVSIFLLRIVERRARWRGDQEDDENDN